MRSLYWSIDPVLSVVENLLLPPFLKSDKSMTKYLIYIVNSSKKGQFLTKYLENWALILTEAMSHYSNTNINQSITFLFHQLRQCIYFHLFHWLKVYLEVLAFKVLSDLYLFTCHSNDCEESLALINLLTLEISFSCKLYSLAMDDPGLFICFLLYPVSQFPIRNMLICFTLLLSVV